ncbi:hypothetical protein O3M35_005037 [Rhynocoris fuscipes]|uniref:4Fe-4S ferredoxin-type domain-containing protein n=1 Tax=Rhynocoris fuscipes TaxID=488301 RepID=A0AAW1DI56_9HEMI
MENKEEEKKGIEDDEVDDVNEMKETEDHNVENEEEKINSEDGRFDNEEEKLKMSVCVSVSDCLSVCPYRIVNI